MIISEDYVNYEIAKLLKEKGFDNYCRAFYEEGKTEIEITDEYWRNTDSDIREIDDEYYDSFSLVFITAPTLQMAMKWLREVFNIFIEISTSIDLNGKYHFSYIILDKECKYIRRGDTDFDWNYKQACEAAIKYCLTNLI